MKKYKYFQGNQQLQYNPNKLMRVAPSYNLNAKPDYTEGYKIASQYGKQHAIVKGVVGAAGGITTGMQDDINEFKDDLAGVATGGMTKGMGKSSKPTAKSLNSYDDITKTKNSKYNYLPEDNFAKSGKNKLKYFKGGKALGATADLAGMAGTAIEASAQKDTGEVDSAAQAGGMALQGAGMGASIGAVGGPVGALVGAGVGAIAGGIYGAVSGDEQNKKVREARKNAEFRAADEKANAQASGVDVTYDMKIKNGIKKVKLSKYKYKKGCDSLCNCDSCKGKYKKGVREILTEDREAHFVKSKGKYKLLNDVTKPVTHENNKNEGRNAVVVPKDKYKLKDIVKHNMSVSNNPKDSLVLPEGASIVTANKGLNKVALNAYKRKDYKTIDNIVNAMPSDGKKKYVGGDDELEIDSYGYDNTGGKLIDNDGVRENKANEAYRKKLHFDKAFRASEIKKGNAKFTDSGEFHYKPKGTSSKNDWEFGGKRKQRPDTGVPLTITPRTLSNPKPDLAKIEPVPDTREVGGSKNKTPNKVGKRSSVLDNLSLRVSDVNNIIQGAKAPRKNTPFIPNLVIENYKDLSDPTRRKSKEKEYVDATNARNLSGGSLGNYRANRSIAGAENFKNQQEINTFEVGRVEGVNTRNVDRKNRFEENKAAVLDKTQERDFQEIDAKEAQLQKGLEGFDENNFRTRKLNQENNLAEQSYEMDKVREDTKRKQLEYDIMKAKKKCGTKKIKYKMK